MGEIVAIGGYVGHGGRPSMNSLPIDRKIVRLSGKKKPRVLFIPTGTEDWDGYIDWFHKTYREKLKCLTDTLLLYKETPTKKQIARKILWADIIYVGGGNTLKMMKRWKRFGVDKLLRKAHKRNIILCGVSAGSICWFQYGVSDSRQFRNPTSKNYIRVAGLGLVKNLHCPHFKSKIDDKGFRSKGLKEISKRTPGTALAIEDGCAVEILNHKYRVIPFAGGKAYKVYWKRGKYIQEKM